MRRVALTAIVMSLCAATSAGAQVLAPEASALFEAPFKARAETPAVNFRPAPLDRPQLSPLPTFSFGAGPLAFDVEPALGFGAPSRGGRATASAAIRLRSAREQAALKRLDGMGVREGVKTDFADKARWYLFAAASGRGVGLNMLHQNNGDWNRGGWTTDSTSRLVGDGQIAIAWRKGAFQSAFGVITREVRGNHMIFAQHTYEDYVAAWSFSIRPQW